MSDEININIQADYLSFKDEIIEKLGPEFAIQTDIFFDRAVHEANRGLFPSAIRDAQFAYSTGVYEKNSYRLVYLIGFLCQAHIDIEDYQTAKGYLELAYKMMDKSDQDYERDKELFDSLKNLIQGEDWQT